MEEVNKRSRIGATTQLAIHDSGLFIIIGISNKQLKGSSILGAATLSKIERLKILECRIHMFASLEI